MTALQINPGLLISTLLLIISFFSFVFIYNKFQKNRVDKEDLQEMRRYIDQQDGHLQKDIDNVNARIERLSEKIDSKLDKILDKMIK